MSVNSNILTFEKTTVPLITSATPDADGYYDINAGGYGVFNESGIYYAADNIEKLFESTSRLQRRIEKGVLFSEMGHPIFTPGMTDIMKSARVTEIREDRYCGHIKSARLVNSADKKHKITRIMIAPFGHFKSTLADALTSKHANCYFSVRSLSHMRRVNGIATKYVYEIITWDFVTEGGIRMANKFDTNLDLEAMSYDDLSKMINTEQTNSINLDDTREVQYVLNNLAEYRMNNADLESNEVFSSVTDILAKAVKADREELIFNW